VADGPRRRLRERSGLYLIITEPKIDHATLVAAAVERAVPVIQLREKSAPDEELEALARRLSAATRGTETLFIVNDRPDLAAAVGADGVHVGRADTDAGTARDIVGPDAIVGVSANTPGEVDAARLAGADYVGAGPVYPTATKPDARAPIGLDGLRAVVGTTGRGLPVVAIGGITSATARAVLRAGADYVAVVSAICHADDPIAAMDEFLDAISKSTS
jgi:thiamine-phosphate diphosphorylase